MVLLYFPFGVSIYTSYILLAKSCHTAKDVFKMQIRRAPVWQQP